MRFIRRKESWRRFGFKAGVTLLVLLVAGMAFASRYRIGIDPQVERSLPSHMIYLIDLHDQALARGNIYAFRAKGLDPFFSDGTRMVKILEGMPGDTVEVAANRMITVNGEYVGYGLKVAELLHAPKSNFVGRTTLDDDNYWFLGTHSLSFDSRYWGAVHSEQVIGRVYPLF